MAVSILLLAEALRSIPVGTGYAVWTGIGAAGTGLMGILWFGESRDMLRLFWLVLIILRDRRTEILIAMIGASPFTVQFH